MDAAREAEAPVDADKDGGQMLIGVVGPCSAGKTTLARGLRAAGYRVREIRQEHSGVPDMWRRMTNPDLLVYLDVSQEEAARRERLDKPSSWWGVEREERLAHARAYCDCYVDTSTLTPHEVLERVLRCLRDGRLRWRGEQPCDGGIC